jgi:hypothetical protein
VDGAHHLGHRALDNLAPAHQEAAYRQRLWEVDSSHRLWPVATRVDASAKLAEVIREPLFVLRHR